MIEYSFGSKHSQASSTGTIISPQQVHGTHVHVVTFDNLKTINPLATDALVTSIPGISLTVVTADCVPIVYYDQKAQLVGISHSGWKGLSEHIIERVLEVFGKLGAQRSDIQVAIGPAIGPCCYPIYGTRKELFQQTWGNEIFVPYQEHMGLNLVQCAYTQLIRNGIPESHINYAIHCTSCQENTYWSYRRDGTAKDHMVHVIKL